MSIYDTMQFIKPDVQTICVGMAASMGAFLLAAGAKGLAVMKEGRIPSKDGTALVGEGMKQGYRASELLDLSREVKRRGSDFEEGRASLKALREQVLLGGVVVAAAAGDE